jgi:glutaredoxin
MNKLKLFTKTHCPQCVHAKRALDEAGIEFITKGIEDLPEACDAIGMDVRQIKSAPVLIQGDSIWTGEDCVVAVEEGELV